MNASAETDTEAKERFELAKLTYGEVLDATKHQDDKVGRFLTAIAFLTGAAIAFVTRQEVLQARYDIDGFLNLPAILFGTFIIIVVSAVFVLLMALGQPLRPPRSASEPRRDSRLFFLRISAVPLHEWERRWGPDVALGALRQEVTNDLVTESHNIADRADRKYRRTGEAQALFTIALVCFGLASALAINVLAEGGAALAWDTRAKVIASSVLAAFALVLGVGWFYSRQPTEEETQAQALRGIVGISWLIPPALLALPGITALVAVALLAFQARCWLNRWERTNKLRQVMAGLAGVLALGGTVAVLFGGDRWRLLAAAASVALLEMPRLLGAAFRPATAAATPRR